MTTTATGTIRELLPEGSDSKVLANAGYWTTELHLLSWPDSHDSASSEESPRYERLHRQLQNELERPFKRIIGQRSTNLTGESIAEVEDLDTILYEVFFEDFDGQPYLWFYRGVQMGLSAMGRDRSSDRW